MKAVAAPIILSVLALAACNDKAGDNKPASQIAAKVNEKEISIHQINFLLQRVPDLTPEKTADAKRQILEGLVDQELAVQQAMAAKLDRDPKVMQSLEAARREVLARAYLESTLAGRKRPTPEAVHTYYKDHPELFTERKVYRLQEVGFAAPADFIAAIRDQIAKTGRSDEALAAVRTKGIPFTSGVMVKAAENIALDILPRLAQMKVGQSALFDTGDRAAIITVMEALPQPLSEEAAKPYIEQFLAHRQESELTQQTMQHLRETAKIEYVGEFGQAAELARKNREAEIARKAEADRETREAARLAAAAEAAKQAEAVRKAREEADAARAQAPGRLQPPPDSAISKGIAQFK